MRPAPLCLVTALVVSLTPPLHAQDHSRGERAEADTARRSTLPTVEVIGGRDALRRIPGSGVRLSPEQLIGHRVLTTAEAVRKVPGVHVREEEGLGLRPNIGIRGLNPNRSSTVLLLEDGIPLSIAPYGDNAAYYHPPINRFDRVEILKGSGQILHGPRTIGGVINYLTPDAPARPQGSVTIAGGGLGYRLGQGFYGGTWNGNQLSLGLLRKAGNGAREHTGTLLTDLTLKAAMPLDRAHTITLKVGHYTERSNATYAGLTEAEYAANPRWNPFRHDSLFLSRTGLSGAVRSVLGEATLITTVYGYSVSRDWWRQSNSSTQRPLDSGDPGCGGMANLSTTCGTQGGLRNYLVWGIEPRLSIGRQTGAFTHLVEIGARAHLERQDRQTVNGAFPNSRTAGPSSNPGSGISEDNLRRSQAYSAWIQDRIIVGDWTISPGLRVEGIRYERVNRLPVPDAPAGVSGSTSLLQLIPGLGVTRQLGATTTLYTGIHRGFAPPRTEDLISNTSGGVVELDAELSWNLEVGVRSEPVPGLSAELTGFRMDFQNQIIPANLAGGTGAALTSAGRTLHQGTELMLGFHGERLGGVVSPFDLTIAWTWLPVARYEGTRLAWIGTGGSDVAGKVYASQNGAGTRTEVSVSGNRLPYAPALLLTTALTGRPLRQLRLTLEAVHVGSQHADAANSPVTVPDGQQGPIPPATWWNAAANFDLPVLRGAAFLSAKNLFDQVHIVDRSRGLLPSAPRALQVGVVTGF